MRGKKNKQMEQQDGMMLNVINQIITLFPELENKKDTIINKLTNNGIADEEIYTDLIFDKIILNNTTYYKDKINYLWTVDASVVGVYINDTTYYLFSDVDKLNDEIKETFNKINKN